MVVYDVIRQGDAGGLTDVIGFLQQRPEFFLAMGLGEGAADRCPVICRQDVVSAVEDEFAPYFDGDVLCDAASQARMIEDIVDLLRRFSVIGSDVDTGKAPFLADGIVFLIRRRDVNG